MTRSVLAGGGIKAAKTGHTLGRLTMQLFYATDFIDVLSSLSPALTSQPQLRIVTNAGGINLASCAQAAAQVLARGAPVVQQSAYIRRPLGILAATYRQVLIALALSAAILLQERHRRRLGWLAALVVFTYSYNMASCLEVAVVHTLDNPRYMTVQMFFIIFTQFLTILLILEVLLGSRDLIGRKPASQLTKDPERI